MWPWAHVAAAYLLLSGVLWLRSRRQPTGVEALAVGFGALLPDLIDKPLAWRLDVLPYGRTLAHSLLLAGAALVVVGLVARRYGHLTAYSAFAIGYLAHLAGDGYQPFLLGEWGDLFFLAWPLAAVPETNEVTSVLAQLQRLEPEPFFLFGVAVTVAGMALWWSHGRPGISTVRAWLGNPTVH